MSPSDHEVNIEWHAPTGEFQWIEACALVTEVFGLPGDRFLCTPATDFMIFCFKSKKDAALCRILLSEHL